jgi:Tol biopolymer transport system component
VLVESDRAGDWALYAVDPATGASTRMMRAGAGYFAGHPVPSPDGRKVLLPESRGFIGLHVVGVDGRGRRLLARGRVDDAAWSPDGKRVAFGGQPGVVVVRADGTHRKKITRVEGTSPAWSPDGTLIAFSGTNGLYVVDADGGPAKRLWKGVLDGGLAWSPHGRTIALAGYDVRSNLDQLLAVDADTGRIRELARNALGSPVWSPDGKQVAYLGTIGKRRGLLVVGTDGSKPRPLALDDGRGYVLAARWAPDGKRVVLSSGEEARPGDSELVELRSLRGDGSGERILTHAYPDGGNNYLVGWVRGDVRSEPPPRPRASGRLVRVPYAVGAVSAHGTLVAAAPLDLGFDAPRPSGPLVVWRPASGELRRFVVAGCYSVLDLELGMRRVTFDCDKSAVDSIFDSVRTFPLVAHRPVELFRGRNGFRGNVDAGTFLGGLAGDGDVVVFTTETSRVRRHRTYLAAKRLWRVEGRRRRPVATDRDLGDPVSVDEGRVLLQGGAAGAEIVSLRGRVLARLPLPELRTLPNAFRSVHPRLILDGERVVLVDGRRLRVYDARSGRALNAWPLPRGRKLLGGAATGLVAYVRGNAVHVVRLRDGREKVIRVAAARPTAEQLQFPAGFRDLVHADLSAAGLVYSYNVPDERYPGRVVFVPRARLGL